MIVTVRYDVTVRKAHQCVKDRQMFVAAISLINNHSINRNSNTWIYKSASKKFVIVTNT